MADVTARIKVKGKTFEISVNCDKAMDFKKGKGVVNDVLLVPELFYELKKGTRAKESDLTATFGTTDIYKIAEKIIKEGEILLPIEYRNRARETKLKQIVDFIATNCADPQKGMPHPPERIKTAIDECGIRIEENKSAEDQIPRIIKELQKALPLKMEIKKLSVHVPAEHTGKVYGLLQEYAIKEEWLGDGSLMCIISIPVGMQMSFFDKLNNVTHGSAVTQEIKE